jgi:hypothetical protein
MAIHTPKEVLCHVRALAEHLASPCCDYPHFPDAYRLYSLQLYRFVQTPNIIALGGPANKKRQTPYIHTVGNMGGLLIKFGKAVKQHRSLGGLYYEKNRA